MEVLRWGYQIPFRRAPVLSKEPIPFPAYCPNSIRGKALEGEVQSLLDKGAIEPAPLPSGLLQPVVRSDESLRSIEAGHRSLYPESEGSADILQDGDSPICASVSTPWRLDGVSGLEGCVLAGSDASGISQVPQVHGGREGVPVQGSLLWTLHRSSGFHQGHGSCVCYSSQDRGAALPLPRRLVTSGLLSGAGSPCSEDSAPALQFVRNSRQLGEVSGDSDSTDSVSGSHSGLDLFQGFSCPEESQEASLNWRHILVLRKAASIILAGAIRSTVFDDPARSGRPTSHEVSSACSAEALGPCRSIDSGRVVSRGSPGSRLMARSRTVGARRFSGACVPSARIVVRRLGRGLGGSSRRSCYFRPLGSRGGQIVDQCQRAPGHRESSPVVCSSTRGFFGGNFRRQLHGHCLPQEPGRHAFSSSELHCAEDSLLGGVSSSCDLPTVHHGEAQRAGGCFVSPEPDSGLRMDTETGGLSGSVQEVVGLDRPFCQISKSPMFNIFFTLPRSECSGNGCASSELEWVAGVCLSSLVSNSSSSEEAPVVLWCPSNHNSTLLVSEPLVSRSSGSGSGRTGSSSSVQRSPAPAPLPSIPSRGVQAVASCLETIQRFTRARGFSKRVAQQVSLARRPSSRAGYQAKWLVFRRWCRSEGHSVSRPSLSKIADFLFWLRRSRRLSVSAVMGYRSMLSAVFKSILPEISTSPTLHDLLRSFQVEAPVREVRPPSWDLPTVLNFLRSSPFEPLSSASLRDLTRKTLFLIALATAKRVGELQALSRLVSFSSSAAGLSYVPEFVAKTETATRPLPRSFEVQSLGDFAAGLPEELLLCPVRSLSAYMTRTSQVVNRPRRLFVSPKCPSRAMSKNGISYMLREVIVQSGASSQSGRAPRAHSIHGIATSSALFRNWSLRSVLEAASWHSNTIFTSFYFRDLQFTLHGVHSLGPFVAAGERIG